MPNTRCSVHLRSSVATTNCFLRMRCIRLDALYRGCGAPEPPEAKLDYPPVSHSKSDTPGVALDRLSKRSMRRCPAPSGAVTVVDIKKHRRQQNHPLDHLLVVNANAHDR